MYKGIKEVKDADGKLINEVANKLKGGSTSVSLEKSQFKDIQVFKIWSLQAKRAVSRMVAWQCALFWKAQLVSLQSGSP